MASNKEIVWPPQTTEDVLNLTPRKSRTAQNAPCSPSPLRRAALPSPFSGNGSQDDDEDTDDDDEETLKLKLAQIEAKLKLKQFQKKQKGSQALGQQLARNRDRRDHTTAATDGGKAQVQVPLSPVALKPEPAAPKSPSRVLLGIDKGLKGRDVSLRRAPSLRTGGPGLASPQRPKKTFSERIAEERVKEKSKLERQHLLEKSRSTSFLDFGQDAPPIFGLATMTMSASSPSPNFLGSRLEPHLQPSRKLADPFVSESSASSPSAEDATDEGGFDSYSGLHLSKRTISHVNVCRHLSPRTVYLLPHLLKSVVSPDFDPPDVEGDWVAMGVICSKSTPRDVGQNTDAKGTGKKYMVLQLTDLKWEVELFLFGSAFDKFWKVPIGTVVAILNPGIMKPRNADTGKFSLTLTDSSDTLLEIGHSRDLDFCKAVKRDGKRCSSWVDKRHTHYCAFHVEQGVNKSRVARAEVNSMSKLFSPPRKPGGARPRRFLSRKGDAADRDDGLLPDDAAIADVPQRAGGAGGKVFVAPGRSTASLLDDQNYLTGSFHRGSKEDRLRKRLADSQKEREITRRLIKAQGREGGVGVDYLKKGVGWNEEQLKKYGNINREYNNKSTSDTLSSLRQKSKEASTVSLSPIKRKRLEPPLSPKKKTRFALALEPVPEHPDGANDDDDDLWIV